MRKRKEPQFETFDSFDQLFNQAEKRSDYWEERAKLEFTREVVSKMHKDEVSKTELASRLDVQPGMVTRLLSGRNNFELSTMVRMAMALNCRYRSHLEPLGAQTMWFDVFHGGSQRPPDEAWNPGHFRKLELEASTCEISNHESFPIAA